MNTWVDRVREQCFGIAEFRYGTRVVGEAGGCRGTSGLGGGGDGGVGGGGGSGAAGSAPSAEGAGSVSGDTLSVLGGASGGLSVRLGPDGKRSAGIVLHVGEGYASNEGRTVGAIDADVRWPSADGPYAFLGFAHRHETTLDLVVAHPVGATLATLPGIEHRTGFEVGGGWDFPTPRAGIRLAERVLPIAQLALGRKHGLGGRRGGRR